MQTLQQKFVCVRLVQMKGVDLSLFQFDWDLTWHVYFLNADGTIYGRYGTRAGPRNNQMTHVSLLAFKRALERALSLHRAFPENKAALAGKRGAPLPYRIPEAAPELKKHAGPTTAQNCIHCHMVGDSLLRDKRGQKQISPADIWSYPLPENIGMRMELDNDLRVKSVLTNSPAAQAGLLAGDDLVEMNGQPLISQADIQWILQHAPAEMSLTVAVRRGGETLKKTLRLSGNWRKRDKSWSDTAWGIRPGVQFERISAAARQQAGITGNVMALRVRYAFREAAAAGLRAGDIVTAVDGETALQTEEDFLAFVYLRQPPPDSVKLALRRKGQTLEVTLPILSE